VSDMTSTSYPTESEQSAPAIQPVARLVPNFEAELAEMHGKMREHLNIDQPPPAIILWRPDRTDFQVFCWPSPWLH